MKKTVLTFVFAAITIASFAQSGFGVGVRYGIGLNSASFDPDYSTDGLTTPLNFALIAEKDIVNNFALQGELQYIQKGYSVAANSITTESKFSYLGLNILPKVKFGKEQIEGFVFAGPSVNFKLSATSTVSGSQSSHSSDISGVSGLDFSGVFGGGAAYKLSSGKIFLDARYNLALTKANSEGSQSVKLNQIGINVGYIHNIGK